MKELVSFLQANPVVFLGTAENGMPHVRPIQFMFEEGGRLYFCTANTKDMYKQMKAMPYVEFATTTKDYLTTLRIGGKVVFADDHTVKERILEQNDLVRSIYKTPDNPVFESFFIEHGTAKFFHLNGQPPETMSF